MSEHEQLILVVAVAFVLFWALIWWKGRAVIAKGLDEKIGAIREELDQAASMRSQAKEMLNDAIQRQQRASEQAQEIIASAEGMVAQMAKNAETQLVEVAKNRKQQGLDMIDQSRNQAIQHLRQEVIGLAIASAKEVLQTDFAANENDPLVVEVLPRLKTLIAKG